MKCNQPRPGFELVSPCPFPSTITITLRAPPSLWTCLSFCFFLFSSWGPSGRQSPLIGKLFFSFIVNYHLVWFSVHDKARILYVLFCRMDSGLSMYHLIVWWNFSLFTRHTYLILLSVKPGGACGVMVIVVGNGHGDTGSNPGRDWLHFT